MRTCLSSWSIIFRYLQKIYTSQKGTEQTALHWCFDSHLTHVFCVVSTTCHRHYYSNEFLLWRIPVYYCCMRKVNCFWSVQNGTVEQWSIFMLIYAQVWLRETILDIISHYKIQVGMFCLFSYKAVAKLFFEDFCISPMQLWSEDWWCCPVPGSEAVEDLYEHHGFCWGNGAWQKTPAASGPAWTSPSDPYCPFAWTSAALAADLNPHVHNCWIAEKREKSVLKSSMGKN